MSKTLQMIKQELPRTIGEIDHNLLYQDICQATKEVDDLVAETRKQAAQDVICMITNKDEYIWRNFIEAIKGKFRIEI